MGKKKLLIVESPSKAETIKKYVGKDYSVMASVGHIIDLPKSQLGVDIDHDFQPKYITIRGKGDLLTQLKKEAKSASEVYLATDPDREGEAISWHLANALKIDVNSKCRVTFNEITKSAVKAAIKEPRAIDMDLVDASKILKYVEASASAVSTRSVFSIISLTFLKASCFEFAVTLNSTFLTSTTFAIYFFINIPPLSFLIF